MKPTKHFLLAFFIGFVNLTLVAQNLEKYSWGAAQYAQQDSRYATSDQVYVNRIQKTEFNFDEKKQSFEQIVMNHFVIQVNTEKGLKNRRELEPPTESKSREVIEFKARIIHQDGTTYEFKKSDLKEKKESERKKNNDEEEEDEEDDTTDEEDEDTYTYYDLSDLKPGSQLEYFVILKIARPSMSGSMLNYQSRIPVQNFYYELSATKEFSFAFKSYNGAPQVVKDSTNKVRSVYILTDRMVDAFPKEKFSNYGANIRGFIYKLDGYELGKKKNIFNNEDFSRNLYNVFYNMDKKEIAVVKKVIKQSKLKSLKTDEEKIIALENYIKSNFGIFNIPGLNALFNVENLYTNNAITGENAARLMVNAFNILNIEHELILGCNRFDYRFDKDFSSNYFMDRFLLYFPAQKKYMDPNSQGMRLGMIPGGFTHNNALFIRSVTTGGVTSGIGKVKFIEALSKDVSKDRLEIEVSFKDDLKSANVNLQRTMTGYFATDWQPFYRKLDAEQRVRFDKELVKFIDDKMDLQKSEYFNVEKNDIQTKPFIVKGKGESKSLMTQSSDTLIFKIGKLIGAQTDMYKENETRTLPIERSSSRTYERVLVIELPEMYRIQNINDLNKHFELKNESGQVAALFKSTYELQGNKLTVTIEEWFEDIILPASKYEDFKNVINASADFHKLELQLLKK